MDTRDELLARILGAAARIKKRGDNLRRKTRDLFPRIAKCSEVDYGILYIFCELQQICHVNVKLY